MKKYEWFSATRARQPALAAHDGVNIVELYAGSSRAPLSEAYQVALCVLSPTAAKGCHGRHGFCTILDHVLGQPNAFYGLQDPISGSSGSCINGNTRSNGCSIVGPSVVVVILIIAMVQ